MPALLRRAGAKGANMRIHRVDPETAEGIARLNAAFQDHRLTYAARGVLGELLSYGDRWEGNADSLWELGKQFRSGRGDGRRAIRAAFAELEAVGYLVRRKTKDANGRYVTFLDLYDEPFRTPNPEPSSAPSRVPKAYLYRHWDAEGKLLYVGVTTSPRARTRQHLKDSRWIDLSVEMTVEPHPSRAAAEEAEAAAITSERPLFNEAGTDVEARRRLVEYLVEHGRTDLLAPAISRG
jgi:hypothetical protein